MRYVANVFLVLAVAVWLGCLVAIFMFVPQIFDAFGKNRRSLAGEAANAIFVYFSVAQLPIAAAALIGAFLSYIADKRNLLVTVFFTLALTCVGAIVSKLYIVKPMAEMFMAGESSTNAQFKTLHGYSMILYTTQAAMLLAVVAMLPGALRGPKASTPPATDPA